MKQHNLYSCVLLLCIVRSITIAYLFSLMFRIPFYNTSQFLFYCQGHKGCFQFGILWICCEKFCTCIWWALWLITAGYMRGTPKTKIYLLKKLCIYSYMFILQSPSKCSPFDAIHLFRCFFQWSKTVFALNFVAF